MTQPPPQREFTEEEIRQIEAEMERLQVDDVLLQTLVTLINLGARKAGLATPPGEEGPAPDLEQTQQAIDGARALIELIVACVAQALREIDAGEVPPAVPGRLIEENMWRALRYGQDGKLLDLEAPTIYEYPASEAAERLKLWTGCDVSFPAHNGAQRQRRMIDAGHSPYEVFKQCVEETRATYPAQEKVQ